MAKWGCGRVWVYAGSRVVRVAWAAVVRLLALPGCLGLARLDYSRPCLRLSQALTASPPPRPARDSANLSNSFRQAGQARQTIRLV